MSGKKVSKKKALKNEMKADKRAMIEAQEKEKEEKRVKQAEEEEERKKIEEEEVGYKYKYLLWNIHYKIYIT